MNDSSFVITSLDYNFTSSLPCPYFTLCWLIPVDTMATESINSASVAGGGSSIGGGGTCCNSASYPLCPPSPIQQPLSSSIISIGIGRHGAQPHIVQRQNNPMLESIHSTFDNIRNRLKGNGIEPGENALPLLISGTLAFYTTAFSSQLIQYKILKMSTGTRPAILPTAVGVMTVAMGSWMGHLAGLGTTAAWSTVQDGWREKRPMQRLPEMGGKALKSVEEMTRPMKIFVDGNSMNARERCERKEAWMHAARM